VKLRALISLSLCIAALLAGASTASASVYVYWGNQGTGSIGRADSDGASSNPGFINGTGSAHDIATDRSHIYWADSAGNRIGRAAINGVDVQPGFIATPSYTDGVAVSGSHVYYANSGGHAIGRANLDGTNPDPNFINLPMGAAPNGMAIDGGHIYWADYPRKLIGRATLDGATVEPSWIITADNTSDVDVDSGHVYWVNGFTTKTIGRADISGAPASVNQSFITDLDSPCGLAVDVDFGKLLVTNSNNGTIGRASLIDGGAAPTQFSGLSNPCGIAVDHGFEVPPGPSNAFTLGTLHRNKRRGTAKLEVTVPGAGALRLSGKGAHSLNQPVAAGTTRRRIAAASSALSTAGSSQDEYSSTPSWISV